MILFVDDLGYNEINLGDAAPPAGGYTGYGGRVKTPALARFAAEGVLDLGLNGTGHYKTIFPPL